MRKPLSGPAHLFNYRRLWTPSLAVQVYVNEIVLILYKKGTAALGTIAGTYNSPTDTVAVPPENFNGCGVVNCWYWVDEPVAGHAIYGRDAGIA